MERTAINAVAMVSAHDSMIAIWRVDSGHTISNLCKSTTITAAATADACCMNCALREKTEMEKKLEKGWVDYIKEQ